MGNVKFYCWENFSKLLPERKFLTTKISHFPLKIFVSLKIFEEFAIFEDLRRIFELTKILRIRLQSIFRNQRIFVFVFGLFSIFVATLTYCIRDLSQDSFFPFFVLDFFKGEKYSF